MLIGMGDISITSILVPCWWCSAGFSALSSLCLRCLFTSGPHGHPVVLKLMCPIEFFFFKRSPKISGSVLILYFEASKHLFVPDAVNISSLVPRWKEVIINSPIQHQLFFSLHNSTRKLMTKFKTPFSLVTQEHTEDTLRSFLILSAMVFSSSLFNYLPTTPWC